MSGCGTSGLPKKISSDLGFFLRVREKRPMFSLPAPYQPAKPGKGANHSRSLPHDTRTMTPMKPAPPATVLHEKENMLLITTNLDTNQAHYDAAAATEAHLRRQAQASVICSMHSMTRANSRRSATCTATSSAVPGCRFCRARASRYPPRSGGAGAIIARPHQPRAKYSGV